MTYKPKTISSGFSGITGAAKVKFTPDKKQLKIRLDETGKVYTIKYSKDTVPFKNIPEGSWMVTIAQDGSKLIGMRPIMGMFQGHVIKFPAQEGQPPTPRTSNGEFPFQYFTVLIELTSPKNVAGMIVPFSPRYNFSEVDEDGKAVVGISHPKSKYTPMLMDFLDATGAWERGPIPFKDNILPILEKRILKADSTFSIVMKEGWVTTIMGESAEETEVDDEEKGSELPWGDEDESKDDDEETTTEDESDDEESEDETE